MTKEEKLKSALLTIYDIAKLADKSKGFSKCNNLSLSEEVFRAFEAEGLDFKKVLGLDYLEPTKFKDSVWNN